MSIKLIGLDLDRTTLNNAGKISERTREALQKAANIGVHVVIATGRSFYSMPEDVYHVKGLEFTANSNGAEIRELKTGKTIYSNHIDCKAVKAAHDYLVDKNFMIEVFTDGRAYIQRDEYEAIRSGQNPFRARDYVIKTRTPIDDIYENMINWQDKIENINIFFKTDEEKQATYLDLIKIENATVTSSMPDNLEIGGETTSKATALMYLADKLGIKKDEIMCCGDSPNDIAMLKLAGTAVAVANASDEVKKFANYHTDSNDDDGVAKAIENLVLNI